MDSIISKRGLDRAGKIIRQHQDDDEYHAAIETLNRWREQHILPMDFYFDACNDVAKDPRYKDTVIAERLKRLPTIIDKLDRFPHMHLSSMQDIGGVRVILEDAPQLLAFDKEIRKLPTLKSSKDYLTKPKNSGYRGHHLIFEHDGMTIEVQLRTRLQHLWATSVETVDVIRGTSMKTKSSNSYWQRFFKLASSAFAYIENTPMLPQHQDWDVIRLRDEMQGILDEHRIEESLDTYASTYNAIDEYKQTEDSYYAIVTFNPSDNETSVAYYPEEEYSDAVRKYEELESRHLNDNVLVSVNNLKKLHDTYPNYFKDISEFKETLTTMLDFNNKIS